MIKDETVALFTTELERLKKSTRRFNFKYYDKIIADKLLEQQKENQNNLHTTIT